MLDVGHNLVGRVQMLLVLILMSIEPWMAMKSSNAIAAASQRMTVYAAGFFPVSTKIPEGAIGRGVIPAVELALQHINDSPKVLRGIHLDLRWNDTEVRRN